MFELRVGRLFSYSIVAVLAVGCGGNDKKPGAAPDAGDTSPDAAMLDGAVPVDAPPGITEVHGVEQGRYVTDLGVVVAAQDDSRLTLASYASTAGGVDVRAGTGSADGTFVVPVGAGPWLISVRFGVDSTPLYLDNVSKVDLSFYALGRPDQTRPTKATPVTVNVTGLAPWIEGEILEVVSSNAGSHALDTEFALAPGNGDTAITNKVVDWNTQFATLIDATKGDITLVTQLVDKHVRPDFSDFYVAVAKSGLASGFSIPDGGPATLTTVLSDVPQTRALAVHVARTQFDALRGQVGPDAQPAERFAQGVFIEALPGALDRGIFDEGPRLVQFFAPDGTADFDQTFSYGNPFKTAGVAWDELVRTTYKFIVPVLGSGATTPARVQVGFEGNFPIAALAADGTIAPALSPVRNVKIAGLDLVAPRSGVGLTPMITWDAPAIGTPTDYRVQIERVSVSGTATSLQSIADFSTTRTSIQVPSQVLLRGGSYILVINANDVTGFDPTTPFIADLKHPHFHATSTTAQFTP